MKTYFFICCYFLIVLSCKSLNENQAENESKVEEVVLQKAIGFVRLDILEFQTLIEIDENGDKIYLSPINLPDNYHRDGLRLRFSYLVKSEQNDTGIKTVWLEDVTPLRE